jgi:hypothetical protein
MFSQTQVLARRAGRVAFGTVLTVGAIALAAHAAPGAGDGAWTNSVTHCAPWLLVIWLTAAVAAGATRWAIERLAPIGPATLLRTEGLVVPAVGLALVVPITLHLPFALLMGGPKGFDAWCSASVECVGFAHVVFAGLVAVRARQLADGRRALHPWTIFFAGVAAASYPHGAWLLPEILVAMTGFVIVPMLGAMDGVADRDFLAAESAAPLPGATVVAAPRTR